MTISHYYKLISYTHNHSLLITENGCTKILTNSRTQLINFSVTWCHSLHICVVLHRDRKCQRYCQEVFSSSESRCTNVKLGYPWMSYLYIVIMLQPHAHAKNVNGIVTTIMTLSENQPAMIKHICNIYIDSMCMNS